MAVSPIHPAIRARLDPGFVAFWDAELADKPGLHEIPWHPSIRDRPAQPGGSVPLEVGKTDDIQLETCKVRVFTPPGEPPAGGWPTVLYFRACACGVYAVG